MNWVQIVREKVGEDYSSYYRVISVHETVEGAEQAKIKVEEEWPGHIFEITAYRLQH